VANHPSNERHRASHWQAKLAAEKRWKCRFCRAILPFATETSLTALTRLACYCRGSTVIASTSMNLDIECLAATATSMSRLARSVAGRWP
jgi:hypothetical protein